MGWGKSRAFRKQVGETCNISLVEVSIVDTIIVVTTAKILRAPLATWSRVK